MIRKDYKEAGRVRSQMQETERRQEEVRRWSVSFRP